ncbi:MAG: type II toxin-antitoxin system RelE/ParE family toxin [Hyphomicrobiaceae bacterium]|nr:type II toxin-antitoxin system RelE/ParE family toxin [Hyphomicrobiaceae bacterium]
MFTVVRSEHFSKGLSGLKDRRAVARISTRIDRLVDGNLGDAKPVGDCVSELRIDYGPGYRVYLVRRDGTVVVLLCGGTKKTQRRDIARAKKLALEP